jgi:hypothetical protein
MIVEEMIEKETVEKTEEKIEKQMMENKEEN